MWSYEDLKNIVSRYGQDQLLSHWNELTDIEKQKLATEISELDFTTIISSFKRAQNEMLEMGEKLDNRMNAIPSDCYGGVKRTNEELLMQYENEGLKQISNGHVGVLLMAGGQGTRLGVNYPKGMYDVGLPSNKTLYQLQAERIRKVEDLAFNRTGIRGKITWFIMTSEHTMESTRRYFEKNEYFGLNKSSVIFFEQFLFPAFTFDGKIIMEKKYKISKSPDGNGGLYKAIKERNVLKEIDARNIKYLHAHSVDNILVKVADPIFIGYCVQKDAECGAKVVQKLNPTEALGVLCMVDGKYQVVEYSEITLKTAEMRDSDGKLIFSAGNICNHFFSSKFLHKVMNFESQLKLHVAKKKIPFVDEEGNSINPDSPNGIKIEKFIFDAFMFTNNLVVWEVSRSSEFSALKNSDSVGKDCPRSARESLNNLHKEWIKNAGGKFKDEENAICEISPLTSYAGENLEKYCTGKLLDSPFII